MWGMDRFPLEYPTVVFSYNKLLYENRNMHRLGFCLTTSIFEIAEIT